MNLDYSEKKHYKVEKAILLENVCFTGNFPTEYALYGKFSIPSLTPMMEAAEEYKQKHKLQPAHIQSGNNLVDNSAATVSNYLSIFIPPELVLRFVTGFMYPHGHPIGGSNDPAIPFVEISVPANTEFAVTFVSGDVNKPVLIGVI